MKSEGKNRGEEETTPVTTACPEAEKYKCEKKVPLIVLILEAPGFYVRGVALSREPPKLQQA